MRLQYVNRDHSHPLWRKEGTLIVRSSGKGGPRSELVEFDDGVRVIAPYGNWRIVRERGYAAPTTAGVAQ